MYESYSSARLSDSDVTYLLCYPNLKLYDYNHCHHHHHHHCHTLRNHISGNNNFDDQVIRIFSSKNNKHLFVFLQCEQEV